MSAAVASAPAPRAVDRWLTATGAARLDCWRQDPVLFAWDNFAFAPDPWQALTLWEMADPAIQQLALPACKGAGKTAVLAVGILWFLALHPHCKIPCTSVTGENLRDNLWAELARWLEKSAFLTRCFRQDGDKLASLDAPKTWFAVARRFSRSADPQQQAATLAGYHADAVLFVIDEAGGVPLPVLKAALGGLANAEHGRVAKIWVAGNTTHRDRVLGTAVLREPHLWRIRHITGDPDDPQRAPRVALAWARQQIANAPDGKDDPWVRINVLGRFPLSSLVTMIPEALVELARARKLRADQFGWAPKIIGVDVAGEGDDRNVIQFRQGLAAFKPWIRRALSDRALGALVVAAIRQFASQGPGEVEAVFVDCTGGWGNAVAAYLEDMGYRPLRVNFGEGASEACYQNKRVEMYARAKIWLEAGGALPDISEMAELSATEYTVTARGQLALEPKKDVKARLGASPDVADALVLTFAEHVAPRRGALEPHDRAAAANYVPAAERMC